MDLVSLENSNTMVYCGYQAPQNQINIEQSVAKVGIINISLKGSKSKYSSSNFSKTKISLGKSSIFQNYKKFEFMKRLPQNELLVGGADDLIVMRYQKGSLNNLYVFSLQEKIMGLEVVKYAQVFDNALFYTTGSDIKRVGFGGD